MSRGLGIYLRIERKGFWENLDITEMTVPEIEKAMSDRSREQLVAFIARLAQESGRLLAQLFEEPEDDEPERPL